MKHRLILPVLLTLLLAGISTAAVLAQDVATWSAKAEKMTVRAGESVQIRVTADIEEKWHIYSVTPMDEGPVATEFAFGADTPLKVRGSVKQPEPIIKFDDAFGIDTEYFEENVTFTITGVVSKDAAPGVRKAVVEVTFMSCNDRMCMPPATVEVPFDITIEAGDAEAADLAGITEDGVTGGTEGVTGGTEGVDVDAGGEEQDDAAGEDDEGESLGYGDVKEVEKAKKEGLWAYIGLAMSVGALALLTPCVFPMIPITVSFFTKREQATRWLSVRDALIYSFGIIFTFTGLGILLALTFGAAGINQFAANPWMNMLIATVFIVFALNLFGLFEIVVPSGILTKLTIASGSGTGVVSILLMGLTFTLTSFTCTVPFVGTVMVAAASGEIWWSVVGMLAFSSVFALPFFLLALFPSWLKSMPKSGGWLNSVKVVMGFLEIAAAMKFISNVDLILSVGVLSRDLFLSFWVGIGVFISAYLMGFFILPHDTKLEKVGVVRMLWGMSFFAISIYLFTGLGGKPLGELDAFLPPVHYQETIEAAAGGSISTMGTGSSEEERCYSNYDQALKIATAESKPVFIDFTGFACTNCRWMEANVFTRRDVKKLLRQYVLLRLYTDGRGEVYDRNQEFQEERFGTVALPLYVAMHPDDTEIGSFPGLTRKPAEFVRFLEDGLRKFRKKARLAQN